MHYTYVLRSRKDQKLYIGWTVDLVARFDDYNQGKVEATKYRRPFELIYDEACQNKKDAVLREKSLKTGLGRAYLKKRLSL